MGVYQDNAEAIADGLIHHWTFDDYAGNQFSDQIGDWHGVAINPSGHDINSAFIATPLGVGLNTAAFGIANRDDMVFPRLPVAGRDAAFSLTDFTIRFRYYTETALAYKFAPILALGQTPAQAWDYLGVDSFYLESEARTDTGQERVSSHIPDEYRSTNLEDVANAWVDYVISVHGGVANYFVFGQKNINTDAAINPLKPYTHDGYIGLVGDPYPHSDDFGGVIDELSIWDRGLSDLEVLALYNGIEPIKLIGADAPVVLPEIITNIDRSIIQSISYTAMLTGAGMGLSNLILPISSFNGRSRSGRDSYLSIVVPNGAIYQEEIALRTLGDIIIFRIVDGVSSEFMRVNYDTSRIDNGGASGSSLNLSGYKQTTNSTPKSVPLENCSYYSNTSFRFAVSPDISAGDTLLFNGVETVIDTINYIVSATYQVMELSS